MIVACADAAKAQRSDIRAYYRQLGATKEEAENNYYRLPIEQQDASLATVNAFWRDYAAWVADGAKGAFVSPNIAEAHRNFTEMMLAKTGLIAMIGKAERGPTGVEAIRKHRAAYLMAIGGAAYLVSKAIRSSRCVAFEDLGMEAIYEFTVEEMPVTVAVDSSGANVHESGPAEWRERIRSLPVIG